MRQRSVLRLALFVLAAYPEALTTAQSSSTVMVASRLTGLIGHATVAQRKT
jgi:hypothetical protein